MSCCSHTQDCPLFAQFAMEPSLKLWQQHFCEGAFSKCARYVLSLEGKPVPVNLLPNGKLIEKKNRSKEEMGGTALFNAIYKKRTAMVSSMLKTQMATSSVMSSDGMTPLMAAASVNAPDIVSIVLEAGCNPFNKNQQGKMAVDIAREHLANDCVIIIQKYMNEHPELKQKAITLSDEEIDVEQAAAEGRSFLGNMVDFFRKLNPLSKQ